MEWQLISNKKRFLRPENKETFESRKKIINYNFRKIGPSCNSFDNQCLKMRKNCENIINKFPRDEEGVFARGKTVHMSQKTIYIKNIFDENIQAMLILYR
jgi:hypothetical protein